MTGATIAPERQERARALRDRGSRVGLRRALVLVAMTVLLPGSAQRQCGNRRVGKIVLRVWAGLLAAGAVLVCWAVASPTTALGWATTDWVLQLVRLVLVLFAVAMTVLLLDAWRIGHPVTLRRHHRVTAAAVTTALVVGIGAPLLIASSYLQAERHLLNTVFTKKAVSAAVDGRLNIMLVGGDAGPDRSGIRPDSLSLVSIDLTTGKPVVIGLPRNLENVPFPAGTTMHRLWPHGFNCGNACLLNAIWTWATTNAADFPGVADPGLTATEQAVSAITGLKVNYYVSVDLQSFQNLVNALGGITVKVDVPVPIGGETSAVSGWIEPGLQHLDGYHALWLARSRSDSSDYARMARQRCVLQAMLTQMSPVKAISAFRSIADTAATYTRTDIPASQLGLLAGLAEKARAYPLRKVDLDPPAVPPGNPDWATVRTIVAAAVASTRATPSPSPAATGSGSKSSGTRTSGSASSGSTGSGSTGSGSKSGTGSNSASGGRNAAGTAPAAAAAPGTTSTVDDQAVCSVPR